MNVRRNGLLGFSLFLAAIARAAPTTVPSTMPTTEPSAVEVREWVVFVADAQGRVNGRQAWPSTLAPFMTSRRASVDTSAVIGADVGTGAGAGNRPAPVGVIRLFGALDAKLPIDVLLTPPGGEVEASWPPGQTKPGRLLWSNLVPADPTKPPAALDGTSWLAPLRTGDAARFGTSDQTESFLLYDIAMSFKPPVKLKADGDRLLISNTGSTPLHDITVYKKRDGQWTRGTLALLAGLAPDAVPAPTTTKADPAAAFDAPTSRPSVMASNRPFPRPATTLATTRPATRSTTKPSTTQAATQAATRPTERGTAVVLTPTGTADRTALIAGWRPALTDAGVPESDIGTVEKILADRGLDDRWMTLVYRLDPSELDKLLPLEIIPAPRKITRVGLVIVQGVDPAIDDEIDRLIAQCGDADYQKRKAASAELITLGPPAKAKLEKAQSNPDVEIAQRVETILAVIAKQQAK